jgi:3-oxoacyl-[acyl-carrier-protein] synthase I
MPPTPLAITASGMCTSIGRSTPLVCAALRAGITRPRRIRDLEGLDPDTEDSIPLMAHPAKVVTEGFYKVGRWVRLASAALTQLLGESPPAPGPWALHVVTRTPDEDFLDCADVDEVDPGNAAAFLERTLVDALCSDFGLSVPPSSRRLFSRGAVGVAAALSEAAQQFAGRRLDRVLVVAVDSWIDPTLLAQAADAARLKTPDSSTGFAPGEAAVAFWVEPADAVRRAAGLPAPPVVERVALQGRSDDPLSAPEPSASSVTAAVQDAVGSEEPGDVFLDLSGEEWRARQWGTALVQLAAPLSRSRFHLPAISLGDVGAASGAIGLLLALEALERRWAAGDRCLVVSCAESGEASGIAVRRP